MLPLPLRYVPFFNEFCKNYRTTDMLEQTYRSSASKSLDNCYTVLYHSNYISYLIKQLPGHFLFTLSSLIAASSPARNSARPA